MSKDKSSEICIGEYIIKSSDYERKLSGIKVDSKLHFDDQFQDLYKKLTEKYKN